MADALGSGLSGFTPIGVQLPSSACETSMAEAHASAVRFTPLDKVGEIGCTLGAMQRNSPPRHIPLTLPGEREVRIPKFE